MLFEEFNCTSCYPVLYTHLYCLYQRFAIIQIAEEIVGITVNANNTQHCPKIVKMVRRSEKEKQVIIAYFVFGDHNKFERTKKET